jgi:hypothetical protein
MADADEDAIHHPASRDSAAHIDHDLSDETQDFRFLNNLSMYVPINLLIMSTTHSAIIKCGVFKLTCGTRAVSEILMQRFPVVERKISNPTRHFFSQMPWLLHDRLCTMRSPFRVFIIPKIDSWVLRTRRVCTALILFEDHSYDEY